MTQRPDTDDYRALFLQHTPMMDMRAPVEFILGAFPGALSLPLMSDEERAQVGTCYKHEGQAAAIDLGHALVSGDIKEQRLQAWLDFALRFENGYLYCFRGGLRSQTVQQWLHDAGVDYPLIKGGYKAMRRFLLDEMERSVAAADLILISGKTGTGKTRVVTRLPRAIDLEGLANHRGSSFGQLPTPQPTQIDFENSLSIAFMRLLAADGGPIILEDEGHLVGRVALPESLRLKMTQAPMLVVEEPLQDRVNIVVEDYVIDLGQRYMRLYADEGASKHRDKLVSDLERIRKRLGGLLHQQVRELMVGAFEQQWAQGDISGHSAWITLLLEQYYDPMYEYQLERRGGEQRFTGDREAVAQRALKEGQRALQETSPTSQDLPK